MKKRLLLIALLGSTMAIHGQIKAITETGDEVTLFNDGTYAYVNGAAEEFTDIQVSSKEFFKPENATFLLKSKKNNVGFWLDPKLWTFGRSEDNPDAEYEVELKGEDLYGVVITEKIEIPLEYLRDIALENAQSVAPDMKIVEQEYRIVNKNKLLYLRMDGTLQGMKITYFGHFFSNEKGTTQLIVFTAQNLLNEYKDVSDDFLNGIVVVE